MTQIIIGITSLGIGYAIGRIAPTVVHHSPARIRNR